MSRDSVLGAAASRLSPQPDSFLLPPQDHGISSKETAGYPIGNSPLTFSPEARRLLDAGRELWKYYLSKPGVDIDASFYDIRAYFQGRKKDGSVKSTSSDTEYTTLYTAIQDARKTLGDEKIAPKVYEYGFLLK